MSPADCQNHNWNTCNRQQPPLRFPLHNGSNAPSHVGLNNRLLLFQDQEFLTLLQHQITKCFHIKHGRVTKNFHIAVTKVMHGHSPSLQRIIHDEEICTCPRGDAKGDMSACSGLLVVDGDFFSYLLSLHSCFVSHDEYDETEGVDVSFLYCAADNTKLNKF